MITIFSIFGTAFKATDMKKKVMMGVFIIIVGIGIYYRELLDYGLMQAKGQAHILLNTKQISEVLADKSFPDSLKKQLRLITEIKRFAIDSLGLDASDSYTKFYNQNGAPILWVLTAAEKYQLQAKTWSFPIIGSFSYKGFFDSTKAQREEKLFIKQGYDTQLNEVSAWSTLGFFNDPVLSSMLYRGDGSLANLIIHELTHGTIFIKDNLEINENLASFIGEYGAVQFLKNKYGTNSDKLKKYLFQHRFREVFSNQIMKGSKRLDSLYQSFDKRKIDNSIKDSLKIAMIEQIMASTDTLLGRKTTKNSSVLGKKLPNNAFFVGYLTYQSQQNEFRTEFEQKFNGNFAKYLVYLKKKYPSSF